MPAREMGELRRHCETGQPAPDVDRDERRDVGDRKAVAGDERAAVELAVHPLEPLVRSRALRLAIFGARSSLRSPRSTIGERGI